MAEVRVYRTYFEPIDTSRADAAFRGCIESDLREALKDRKFKLLFHCPDESAAEENLALAAATSREDVAPLMFAESENEGDLILKKERDARTGKDSYYLVGSDPSFTKNAQVLIDGEIYRTDEKGKVDFGSVHPSLSDEMIVIVLPGGTF